MPSYPTSSFIMTDRWYDLGEMKKLYNYIIENYCSPVYLTSTPPQDELVGLNHAQARQIYRTYSEKYVTYFTAYCPGINAYHMSLQQFVDVLKNRIDTLTIATNTN